MSDLAEKVTRALDTWVDPDRVRDAVAVVLEEAATVIENECHDDMTRAEEAAAEIERLRGEVLHLKHDISLVKSMLPPGYKYESFTVGMGLKND